MTFISTSIRRVVVERASNCCEYCHLSQSDFFFKFEIDHIIAEKHGGVTDIKNLCLSCPDCNAYKGSDIGSIDPKTDTYTRLFHPRLDNWDDHFYFDQGVIEPLTSEGRVTVSILRLNTSERVEDRLFLSEVGRYPCSPGSKLFS